MNFISNNYIESILQRRTKYFIGVYSADNLPQNLNTSEKFTLICNHDNVGEAGSHFISIICFPDYVFYLDSFGYPCNIDTIKYFLQSLKRKIFYNSLQLQDFTSSYCGFYCILYSLYFDKIFDSMAPLKIKFNMNNLLENDMLCVEQIKRLV
jgi:hypothetical protein